MSAVSEFAPTKILFVIPAMRLGGSEGVFLNLLRHIDASRFEPHLAVLERLGERLEHVPARIQVHGLGVSRARWAVFALARLCWKLRPKVVLSTSAHMNSAVSAARPLLPRGTVLLTREGSDVSSHTSRQFRFLVYRQSYRRADFVICQSDHMKRDLIRHFAVSPSRVIRIYNPVDIDFIAGVADSEPDPFPDTGPNIVGLGRLSANKGFDLLLKCMPFVRAAVPNVSLTLVGEGPDLVSLSALQHALGLNSCVRFAGLRRNPYTYLKHADAVVVPSRCEALPNVILEAIALGTPVVSTNCTGALNEIFPCTRRLRVVNDRDPEALAKEVVSVLSSATSRDLHPVPEPQFEARFGIRAVVEQYESLFSQCARSRTWAAEQVEALP